MSSLSAQRLFGVAICCFTAIAGSKPCGAGSVVTVGAYVVANQRIPLEQIDHAVWDRLLQKYVDGKGFVDYASWKASSADQTALDAYLSHLSSAAVSRSTNRDAKFAFWINAYNAVTVKGILREYPTSSIRNHTAKLFGYNIWKDLQLPVENEQYSLEQIEHEVLRKMGDPRIHFVIVCASIGCPRLLNEAYTADKLDVQLTSNAKAFFADRTKFQYDAARKTIAVSPILEWFAEDFGQDQVAQMRRIAPYLPDAASQKLAQSGTARVSYLDYDWGLNGRAASRQASNR
ncbi:MAG: DUF547 domain-containing protein [Planctomycetaceae bacterium]